MTDAEYYAAFHAMVLACIARDPTGDHLVRSIAQYGRIGVVEAEAAKRALREMCDSDGSRVDAHEFCHWLELEGVPWSEAAKAADHKYG